MVLNVVTDIYLMSIPIPMLLKASLRPLKKAGLIFLFSGGVFVMVAGILRCVLILTVSNSLLRIPQQWLLIIHVTQDPINGAQQAGSWAVRETFVAVVTSNLPMIFPLISKLSRPVIGGIRSLTSQGAKGSGYRSGSGDLKKGSFKLEDRNPRRGMGPRSINPLTNFSLNESEENIITDRADETQQARSDTDTEAARPPSRGGGILIQTSVQVKEMRKSQFPEDEESTIGDYYLVEQSRKTEEALAKIKSNSRRQKRASISNVSAVSRKI